jgi:hypothetical protein
MRYHKEKVLASGGARADHRYRRQDDRGDSRRHRDETSVEGVAMRFLRYFRHYLRCGYSIRRAWHLASNAECVIRNSEFDLRNDAGRRPAHHGSNPECGMRNS